MNRSLGESRPSSTGGSARPRVTILRGQQANPWELRPWESLADEFDVRYLRPQGGGWFDTSGLDLRAVDVRTMRDILPRGRLGDFAVRVPGDRYLKLADALRGSHIVHTQELGYWYTAQAVRAKGGGYQLVANAWETLPFLDAYRNVRTRKHRRVAIKGVDLFLPATERARSALEVEGVQADRLRVCAPGVDVRRFRPSGSIPAGEPVILSAGRLVWEKGHQELLRAIALLRRRGGPLLRALIVGTGPEEVRLRRHADELGLTDVVEIRDFVPYDQMPRVFDEASALWLGSMPLWSWEEQFGMVLAEAHAAGVPIITTTSGAIPEVAGPTAMYVTPGDWVGLADALAGPARAALREPHAVRDPERVDRFSIEAAAARLRAAYREVLER